MKRGPILSVLPIGALLVACGSSAPAAISPPPAAPCGAAKGRALDEKDDVDGDGIADVITRDGEDLRLYVRRGDCFEDHGRILYGNYSDPSVHAYKQSIYVETRMPHGDRLRETYRYVKGRLIGHHQRPKLVPPPPRGHARSTSSPAVAYFSELRARRATVYIYMRDEQRCADWRFEGDRLVHEDGKSLIRSSWHLSQDDDRVDLDGASSESTAPSELQPSATGPGLDMSFRILHHENTFVELRIVDSTDFNVAESAPERCRWFLTREACERERPRTSCRL